MKFGTVLNKVHPVHLPFYDGKSINLMYENQKCFHLYLHFEVLTYDIHSLFILEGKIKFHEYADFNRCKRNCDDFEKGNNRILEKGNA